ncbi:hypothetical protein BH11MYX4_BH11MYX4_06900 [soil metagenome]
MNALRWFSSLLLISLASLASLTLAAAPGCGGDKIDVKSPTAEPAMDDALSLLPGSAIAVGTVDARAFFSSQTFGADLAKLVEKYVPIGTEAGFQASRDVDRVTFASYSYQGIDVAAIVIGRFDSAKIKLVAANQTPTKSGGTLVVSQYTGRDVYTVNNIGFTLLSDTRAIVGTEQGIRRVLERIKDKRVKRDIAPWMISTVETSGAAFAVAADFASTPIPPENAKQIPSPLITNLKAARLVATFKDGVNLAGSITYADAASAESSAALVKQSMGYAKLLAVFGIKLQNVDIKTDKSDVQVSLLVDDQSLRALLANVPSLMGQ